MSNAAFSDDDKSLVEEIRRRSPTGFYWADRHFFNPFYDLASFILKNVTAHRLDASETTVFPNVLSEERVADSFEGLPDSLAQDVFGFIGTILKEIERASSTGMDEHMFALSLPAILGMNPHILDMMLLGSLAAFAVTHGVWLLALKFICAETGKEDIMIVLKSVTERIFSTLRAEKLGEQETNYPPHLYLYVSLLSSSIVLKPEDNWKSLSSLYNLILVMLKVVRLIHFIHNNIYNNFSLGSFRKKFSDFHILSDYWIARGVFASSYMCNTLPKNGYVIQNSKNLMDICDKLNSIHERFQWLKSKVEQYMDDERLGDPYKILNMKGNDNYYSLMALFGPPLESKKLKLSIGSRKDTDLWTHILRQETLLLIISRLDISSDEIFFLKDTYIDLKTSVEQKYCEFIWVPIHDGPWTTSLEERYTKLSQMMPWYTVEHPTSITEETKKFVRDVWKFYRNPIIVVLDEYGRVMYPNAIHLMYTWGAKAFPFTRVRERALWTAETTRLGSFVLSFDPNLSSMLEAQKWVILYGGGDAEWIKKFIARVHEVTVESDISIELIYAGNNTESLQIRRIKDVISAFSPQSHSLSLRKTKYFWTRLESLLISLSQIFSASDHTMDPFIQEVKKLLSYASADSWACLITPSSDLMIHSLGDAMLQAFTEYEAWKHHLHSQDFNKFFRTYIEQLERRGGSGLSCSHIILNIDNKDAVESLTCPHCTHVMEKKVQYRCCHVDSELK